MKTGSTAVVLLAASALLALHCGAAGAAATIDNVAVQWSSLLSSIVCARGILFIDFNTYATQMHLAQWHALVALGSTGLGRSADVQQAAVAFASRAVLTQYLTFETDLRLEPLLQAQLQGLAGLSAPQRKLAREVGEAVALRVLQRRLGGDPGKQFVLDAATAALDRPDPAPGIYRYENSPGAPTSRFFSHVGHTAPYVLPSPVAFRKLVLGEYGPPAVPSGEWEVQYDELKDIGRVDWPGRTPAMDDTASFWFAGPKKGSLCTQPSFWDSAFVALVPPETSLYDTVELYAKLHVAMHDTTVLVSSLQWGFWFWRPLTAFRTGDPDHAPNPGWTPWVAYNLHPEYPSLTTSITASGAAVMQRYFERKGLAVKPFTVVGGYAGPVCDDASSAAIAPRVYASLAAAVKDSELGRMYAGHHFNVSVMDGAEIGKIVGEYVDSHWSEPGAYPSGVLPDATYLNVFAKRPEMAGMASDIEFRV